jgi:hypothetical protein
LERAGGSEVLQVKKKMRLYKEWLWTVEIIS